MTAIKRILLVDDDEALRQSLAELLLLHEEFAMVEADDGASALIAIRQGAFAAVLLDVGLPDMDGRALCRLMRSEGVRCPIIMITAAGIDDNSVLNPDSGVTGCVAKPFRLGMLLTQLRTHIRQFEQSEEADARIGPYLFRPTAKLLLLEEKSRKIRLTEKETAILGHLLRAAGAVVGRDTLLGEVWGYNAEVTTHTLETHVYRLRQKIERDPSNAEILLTEAGGYRLASTNAAI